MTVADEALRAPVPADLREDALKQGMTSVAFGSMARDFFRHVREELGGQPLIALIYGSHAGEFAQPNQESGRQRQSLPE